MERVSWKDRKTNEEVLDMVGEKEEHSGNNSQEEKELDWTYTERRRTAERCHRRQDGRKATKR